MYSVQVGCERPPYELQPKWLQCFACQELDPELCEQREILALSLRESVKHLALHRTESLYSFAQFLPLRVKFLLRGRARTIR